MSGSQDRNWLLTVSIEMIMLQSNPSISNIDDISDIIDFVLCFSDIVFFPCFLLSYINTCSLRNKDIDGSSTTILSLLSPIHRSNRL